MRYFALVLCAAWLWPISHVVADEIELLLPQNNVSSRPILEFRARKPTLGGSGLEASLTGHAYVLLGRELDNGIRLFNQIKGFYPDGQGVAQLINSVYGKGVVKQKLEDAASEIVFRVYITPIQEAAVQKIFRDWDDKKYSLVVRNCVDFTKEVARAAKLNLPPYPGDVSPEFPATFILGLSQQNEKNTPLRPSAGPSNGSAAVTSPQAPVNSPSRDPIELGQKTLEQMQRALPPNVTMPTVTPPMVTPPPPSPPLPPVLLTPPPPPPPSVAVPPRR